MCGRYTLRQPRKALTELFEVPQLPFLEPRYNIAPSQTVPVVRIAAGQTERQCALVRWGLIPSWAKEAAIGNRLINARSDTAATKPAFRAAFKQRRCLVPADGFYEWKKVDAKKQPYLIGVGDGQPFAFAGLWESWQHDGQTIESCTILTTDANERLRELHDRMPVILPPASYALWLDPLVQDRDRLLTLLQPYPAEEITYYPVSTLVNNARNEDPRCALRLERPPTLFDGEPSGVS